MLAGAADFICSLQPLDAQRFAPTPGRHISLGTHVASLTHSHWKLPKNHPIWTRSMNHLQILFLAVGAAIVPAGSSFAQPPDEFSIRPFPANSGRGVRGCDEFQRFPRFDIRGTRCNVGFERRFVDWRCRQFDVVRTPACEIYGTTCPGQLGRRTPDSVFRPGIPLPNRRFAPTPDPPANNNADQGQLSPPNAKSGIAQPNLPPAPGLVPPNREQGNANSP